MNWVRGIVFAVIFILVGAFAASLWLEIRRETPVAHESPPGMWQGRRIRVEVLNGAGVPGLAAQTTERLRELRFDVVHYGNLEEFDADTSWVLARIDELEPARRVADILGIPRVDRRLDRNLYLDVTVVIGADWTELERSARARAPAGDSGPLSIWWRRVKRAANRLWPG
ncbi:MAG: LytR C-terminal domain-containing protein [Gemmatimonadetes bacterium]|uniref:LytR C-terminal domain-containing protein n=1 Tax=Candidatus Kutchimonas denitrificans TaxID=3056748 RepID=A0AAE4Z778_9BACT|nr:LytR C-terminal domain-containing protein [Gemmatimonadota bacterium]NIR74614.1 LytR C-terminal domain-containing protein [Candidatus Kutchimonas denitrificans]NIS02804.1 LytR C-terminal domain-containing protein [Gemmatimonadota bacterium]NIT68965.1 LytR C-terminal domain-containing protein [Gemmatimonadota bacterium]NIU52270.1 hypothetical protein [Gemmatimonadota bacterium]